MTAGKALCLNMIVKNEMANLERCLTALAPHIGCWIIGDTGSADGTPDFVMAFFAERGLPGELHSFPFENFEQARNIALDHAYASPLAWDYLLFCDADMELVVEEPDFRQRLDAAGYRVLQRSGISYWNTRLVRRDVRARYHGVTHEYLDVPGEVEQLHAVWYRDYASGANRTDKFERDIRLLTRALEDEPDNHRYWFYLAQSLKDAGRTAEAVETYAKRAQMGGWEEEGWYAQMMQARCLRDTGDEGGFLYQALAAFNRRPTRAEPLYDLAKYYRERSMYDTSVLFSEPALTIPRPLDDVLFLEDFVYTAGIKEEYSIAANYARDPARKARGHQACNWLALSREVPAAQRNLARSNLYHYLEPASAMLPSFSTQRVGFIPPAGWHAMNPSVARRGGELVLAQRCVNYTLSQGEYRTPEGAPIETRNFLLRLDSDLEVQSAAEILPPADLPAPSYDLVKGFEDLRLFAWGGALWCVATVRELTPEGWCEQLLARLDEGAPGPVRLTQWRLLHPPGPRLHEKNWMPLVAPAAALGSGHGPARGQAPPGAHRRRFVYLCDPTRIIDDEARPIADSTPPIAAEQFSGGSQAIAFDACPGQRSGEGWLALVHEARTHPSAPQRTYQHRFVWFDAECALRRVSRAFFFDRKDGVEFAAGLAWHPDGERLVISYGVADRESWLATVAAADIRAALDDAANLPFGLPAPAPHTQEVAPAEPEKEEGEKTATMQVEADVIARPAAPPLRIFTTHRTMLYVDAASGELRHGAPESSPRNTQFWAETGSGRILCETAGGLQPILCLADGSRALNGNSTAEATALTVVSRERGRIGLKAGGLFLSAEADGRVTLSRTACGGWETFRLSDDGAADTGVASVADRFLELAPFLRAADRPDERRRLSRGFDARIAPLLDGAQMLPQIHCFYEVLSDAAQHRSLVAATASMRAAGHPVRVWSYAPQKLEFMRQHGVELRRADDVVPRGLFERILGGSEIRYFSDLFRYAVLYEHGGLWMDTDVVLLRPFPFRGDYFLNLQWHGAHAGHFICGNVMYAKPYSRHLRNLYEMAIDSFFAGPTNTFGDIGPKLLSDYVASETGAELRDCLFSPMFFNPIDWTELDRFKQPLGELGDYLNDERVFGIHLWNAKTNALARGEGSSLISFLSDPLANFPGFIDLADRYDTDKNRRSGNRHFYARIYDRLLSPRRFSVHRLMEIGLCRGLAERNQPHVPSVELWQSYFPFAVVIGVDVTDFSRLHDDRFASFVCDQSKLDELRRVAAQIEPGSLDVIIDDGSHASYDEQLTLREFFPLLKEGGWYFIEDLDWQPPDEDNDKIAPTKCLLRDLQQCGRARSTDPLGIGELSEQIADILFFDSHYELERATLTGGLAAIRKRGNGGFG